MSNTFSDPGEPDPFSDDEFAAWRGMLRVHTALFRELDTQLSAEHGMSIDAYGVLITLVGAPGARLPIGELGERRNLTASGISRSIDRLEKAGLVQRTTNPDDRRGMLIGLTAAGVRRLRAAQGTHHRVVREMLLGPLTQEQLGELARVWETAMPGSVTSAQWPLLERP